MQFNWYKFSELTVDQLYDVLALRSTVFVVEQNCVYLDPDGKDREALHLLGTHEDKVLAYARLFLPNNMRNEIIFGRIVTSSLGRGKGYGKLLMQEIMDYCKKHHAKTDVKCSAQLYLKQFYESFGLKAYTDVYQEDDMPHIGMILKR